MPLTRGNSLDGEDLTLAQEAFGDCFDQMCQYVDILTHQGIDHGLIGPREKDRIWARHIFNCAALSPVISEGVSVLDVGSGAGLPGLVLAIARPDLQMTLLEPMLRRSIFLADCIERLQLENIVLERGRAEEFKEKFDVVTCRAVARLPKLLSWTVDLFTPQGELLALKGESAHEEVSDASPFLERHGLTAEVIESRIVAPIQVARIVRVKGH